MEKKQMKMLLIGLFIGIGIGLFSAEYTTVFRVSCAICGIICIELQKNPYDVWIQIKY